MEVSPKINDTTGNSTNGPRVDGLKPCFPVMLSLEAGFEMHRGLKCMFTNDLAPESLRHNTSFLQSRQDLLPHYALDCFGNFGSRDLYPRENSPLPKW